MKIVEISAFKAAIIEVDVDELSTIVSAINEACNGLDVWDFSVRMGAEKPEVLKLLHRLNEVIAQINAN